MSVCVCVCVCGCVWRSADSEGGVSVTVVIYECALWARSTVQDIVPWHWLVSQQVVRGSGCLRRREVRWVWRGGGWGGVEDLGGLAAGESGVINHQLGHCCPEGHVHSSLVCHYCSHIYDWHIYILNNNNKTKKFLTFFSIRMMKYLTASL